MAEAVHVRAVDSVPNGRGCVEWCPACAEEPPGVLVPAQAARLVGIEQIELWQRAETELHQARRNLAAANEVIAMLLIEAGGEVIVSRRTQIAYDRGSMIETHVDPVTDALVVRLLDA